MATISNFGIPGVGTGILQPMLKSRFRVTFASLGGGADSQPVSMQAIKVGKPSFKHEKIELRRYNSVSYVASKHSFDPINLTIQSDVTGSAAAVIQAQLQKQQWVVGAEGQWLSAAGEGSIYKFAMYVEQLDGGEQVIERWIYEGCWIEDIKWGDLDYDASEAVDIELTVSIDNARQVIGGYSQGRGIATGGVGTI
jgi:hypothetical protein